MAAPTTTDAYDEYVAKLTNGEVAQVDSWNIGLYNDSTDLIGPTDTAKTPAITTEPSGSGYTTKTITPSTASTAVNVSGDWKHDVDDQTWTGLSFGVATSVDAWYISATITLSGGTQEYLLAVGTLTGGPFDLQNYTEVTVQDIGVNHSQG